MSEIKLAPCPFCGFEGAKVLTGFQVGDNDNAGDYAVFCAYYDGGCGSASGYRKSREDAIELWNCRTSEQVTGKLKPTRESILKEAIETVCTDREGMYGSPEDNFRLISDLWSNYLNAIKCEWLAPEDVAVMMVLLKIARIATGGSHPDNWIDIAGYAACGGEIEGKRNREFSSAERLYATELVKSVEAKPLIFKKDVPIKPVGDKEETE